MNNAKVTWSVGWQSRIAKKLKSLGFENLSSFLQANCGAPYVTLAKRLGDDVAGLQIEWLQINEQLHDVRSFAMDSLARDINYYLPAGWKANARVDFDTAGAGADWITRLSQIDGALSSTARNVWTGLLDSNPAIGWVPSGPKDSVIVMIFDQWWQ